MRRFDAVLLAGTIAGGLGGCPDTPDEIPAETEGSSSGTGGTAISSTAPPPGDSTTTGQTTAASSSGADPGTSGSSDDDSSSGTGESPLGPFETPVPVEALNSDVSDDDPTLSGDQLEIFFASNRDGDEDVWTSTRSSVDDEWDPPSSVDELNSPAFENSPELSDDGLVLVFSSNRAGSAGQDLWYAERPARGMPWSAPAQVPTVNTAADEFAGTPNPAMDLLFICAVRPDGLGQSDVWVSDADFGTATFSDPTLLMELSSPEADCALTVDPSRTVAFFETTRSERGGGVWNLWTSTRRSPDEAWGEPEAVPELNTDANDNDPWISPDLRTMFLASDRDGTYDIFMAVREPR